MNQLDCVIGKNRYGVYAVPACTAETEQLAKNVLSGGVHEPGTIQYILDNRGEGVVVHAGTYFGDFLPALSGKGHRVYAFEPGLEWYRCAKITLDLNFLEGEHDTKLYNFGLGAERDSSRQLLTMRREDDGEGGASRIIQHPDGVEPFRMQYIELVTIDSMISDEEKNEVTIIHLDIEGYEEEALKGAVEIMRASKPILIIEVVRNITPDTEFYKSFIFGELGYKEIDNVHGNLVFQSTK